MQLRNQSYVTVLMSGQTGQAKVPINPCSRQACFDTNQKVDFMMTIFLKLTDL